MDTECITIYILLVMAIRTSPTKADIWPAEISGSTSVKAGRDIQLKCRISDKMDHFNQVNMYLCKNGVGVQMGLLVNEREWTFILRNVSVLDSGNYSCVYSLAKYPLRNLRASEQKSIQVQVTVNLTKNQENPVPIQFNGFLQAHYMEIVLASVVVVLLLFGIIILCYKVRTFNNLRSDQGQRQKTDGDGLSDSDVIHVKENEKNVPFQPEPIYANA
ncbi:hypothetical protein AOLI_G00093840 [Acnodon oligacanthus]